MHALRPRKVAELIAADGFADSDSYLDDDDEKAKCSPGSKPGIIDIVNRIDQSNTPIGSLCILLLAYLVLTPCPFQANAAAKWAIDDAKAKAKPAM
ncbi:hypothetical protein CFAM422_003115 [Trichoderma lentiforme]|uniref:Uncharacterized protein n=1 Tax=Trichoderma lentiforme TaxID=1567552 RepID=A0A9P4XM90_9HYPO|nr:hypothetical protein CFAM422_003115 [Trichoderma lentiforme]